MKERSINVGSAFSISGQSFHSHKFLGAFNLGFLSFSALISITPLVILTEGLQGNKLNPRTALFYPSILRTRHNINKPEV